MYLEIVYNKRCSHFVTSWQQSCAIEDNRRETRTGKKKT